MAAVYSIGEVSHGKCLHHRGESWHRTRVGSTVPKRGDDVIAVCRSGYSQNSRRMAPRWLTGIDVTDSGTTTQLAEKMAGRRIDVLINNAGILSNESLDDLDFDRMRRQFEVNSLGPLRVTAALRSNLGRGSKVAIITSRMGSIEDNTSGGRYGYRMSKAAVNMAGRSLARRPRERRCGGGGPPSRVRAH